jgi:two-component system OmpR family sensor kinase
MRTNLEVIQGDPRATEEDFRNLSQTFDRSLARVENLVEDLLLLAKGEGQIQSEPTCVEDVLEKVIQETEELAQDQQINVKLLSQANHIMKLDEPLFALVLRNLIHNAIQYNRLGGSVKIDVQNKGRYILIKIEDTGMGIPKQDLPHIFERFYRVDQSRDKHSGGSGLGLSIASHIVDLHDGYIDVESEEGIGSRFTIHLPKN